MSVSNGQLANETTFNTRLMSRTVDTSTVGRVDLSNALAASGTAVSNIQREHNGSASYTGRALNGAKDEKPAWTSNVVGTSTDSLFARAVALTAKFILATGHAHDGTEGNGAVVVAASIGSVPLRGFFREGTALTGATGSSTTITTEMSGKTASSGSTVAGVPVSSPYNRAVLFDQNGSEGHDYIQDGAGRIVYGRVTEAAGVWTLSYYVNNAGVETAHTLSGATNIRWFYQELFNPLGSTVPVYSEMAHIPSENATADVVDATSSQAGKVSTSAQTFGGAKTFAAQQVLELGTLFKHQSSPSNPAAGYLALFAKSDNKLYTRTSAGVEAAVGSGAGGGGSALEWRLRTNAPLEAQVSGMDVLDFEYLSSQEIWAHIRVPDSYTAGSQIKLVGGLFATSVTSNKVRFKATAYLIEPAGTVLGTHSNSYNSTNAEVTAAGVASTITAIGDVDLTNASGEINSVAVAAGDIILIKLIRDSANESASAAADARLLRDSFTPSFGT